MSTIVRARIDLIDANPWRDLKKYPFVETKIEALVRSIKDVGLWEGIIARKVGGRYQLAFGHHRWKAAKKAGEKTIPLIIRYLDDEQMLGFMGRENLEDYNADFLCMLESWGAARSYLEKIRGSSDVEDVEIARKLGWTRVDDTATVTAKACGAASGLIRAGYLSRDDLTGLSVKKVRDICGQASNRMKQVEKHKGATPAQIDQAKRQIARGVKQTVKQVKSGTVASSQVRSQLDVNTYAEAKKAKRRTPLFEQFGKACADALERMLHNDATAQRLDEIIKVVGSVTEDEDARIVARIQVELEYLEKRTVSYSKRIAKAAKGEAGKVIRLEQRRMLA